MAKSLSRPASSKPVSLPLRERRKPIGVFDSGVGGLTVVRQLRCLLPHEHIVYLGDTARVPYGTKSPETVQRFSLEDASFLRLKDVKAVVVACNTASALALNALRREFSLPVFGVIEPGAAAATISQTHRIGVIATASTIRSGAYEQAILKRLPGAHVHVKACPLLVPLVEEGWLRHPVTHAVLEDYLRPLLARNIDTLVLGCTHYPLLKPAIRKVAGRSLRLVDSAESCARVVREQLGAMGLLNGSSRQGRLDLFVTDEPGRFQTLAGRFLPGTYRAPRHVKLG